MQNQNHQMNLVREKKKQKKTKVPVAYTCQFI